MHRADGLVLLGVGAGNFSVLEPFYTVRAINLPRVDLIAEGELVHNSYLQVLAELGIVGLPGGRARDVGFEAIPEVRFGFAAVSELDGFTLSVHADSADIWLEDFSFQGTVLGSYRPEFERTARHALGDGYLAATVLMDFEAPFLGQQFPTSPLGAHVADLILAVSPFATPGATCRTLQGSRAAGRFSTAWLLKVVAVEVERVSMSGVSCWAKSARGQTKSGAARAGIRRKNVLVRCVDRLVMGVSPP